MGQGEKRRGKIKWIEWVLLGHEQTETKRVVSWGGVNKTRKERQRAQSKIGAQTKKNGKKAQKKGLGKWYNDKKEDCP